MLMLMPMLMQVLDDAEGVKSLQARLEKLLKAKQVFHVYFSHWIELICLCFWSEVTSAAYRCCFIARPRCRMSRSAAPWGGNRRTRQQRWSRERSGKAGIFRRRHLRRRSQTPPLWWKHRSESTTWRAERRSLLTAGPLLGDHGPGWQERWWWSAKTCLSSYVLHVTWQVWLTNLYTP